MCTTTPYLSSAKACTVTMGSDTSPHVLRFTGFDHRRERRRLEYAFTHQRCGDGEVSGSGVSEGVCEALTFMEWSTMVVPTYPEGGSHVCQASGCASRPLCRVVRDSKNSHVARDTLLRGRFG